MPFIEYADEQAPFTFKVDIRFHFYEDNGLVGQCKRCGEQIRFSHHARPAEIELAQAGHNCSRPSPPLILPRPGERERPAARERRISFDGAQPR
jgi:hypothetical protein